MLLLTILWGCDAPAEAPLQPHGLAIELENPTYTEHIKPLLAVYCVDCHEHDGVMHAGVELDTYESARSVRVRNACTSLTPTLILEFAPYLIPQDGHSDEPACAPWDPYSMPPGTMVRLTSSQQRMLAVWVANGGPE